MTILLREEPQQWIISTKIKSKKSQPLHWSDSHSQRITHISTKLFVNCTTYFKGKKKKTKVRIQHFPTFLNDNLKCKTRRRCISWSNFLTIPMPEKLKFLIWKPLADYSDVLHTFLMGRSKRSNRGTYQGLHTVLSNRIFIWISFLHGESRKPQYKTRQKI